MIPSTHDEILESSDNERGADQLTSGTVLVAREVLQDPNFKDTVVLVCIHSDEGSYGLVLNRISHMPLSEIFDGLTEIPLTREILIGGPVQQHELQVIDITSTPAEDAFRLSEGIYLGGKWSEMNDMIQSDPSTTRLFLGYSGWGPGQLESEITIGAWEMYTVNLKALIINCHLLAGADFFTITSFLQSIGKS